MKALLLAAGLGTRLRPITNKIPKCLVSINGKILLDIWVEKLINAGINTIYINTFYLSELVVKHIENSIHRSKIIIIRENALFGTAGTLLKNLDLFIGDECLLIHADNYSLQDLTELIYHHKMRQNNTYMTMLTFKTETPSECGIVELIDNVVIQFHEKISNPPGNIANGAVYILTKELLNSLKEYSNDITDFSTQIIPNFLGKINNFTTSEFFIDIGSLNNLVKANNYKHE